jgi:hypothetical protein
MVEAGRQLARSSCPSCKQKKNWPDEIWKSRKLEDKAEQALTYRLFLNTGATHYCWHLRCWAGIKLIIVNCRGGQSWLTEFEECKTGTSPEFNMFLCLL